ncbi:hypothetical protein LENED_010449 [Lentinula edodes]|uniref:Uncharacterized protein n=1 Tax=Lentinula edodes TaxID=5353 RepID=A0A1Q3EMI7_LENED|nr:hypothetical protein LENED_010449 [Lentinula edodes]
MEDLPIPLPPPPPPPLYRPILDLGRYKASTRSGTGDRFVVWFSAGAGVVDVLAVVALVEGVVSVLTEPPGGCVPRENCQTGARGGTGGAKELRGTRTPKRGCARGRGSGMNDFRGMGRGTEDNAVDNRREEHEFNDDRKGREDSRGKEDREDRDDEIEEHGREERCKDKYEGFEFELWFEPDPDRVREWVWTPRRVRDGRDGRRRRGGRETPDVDVVVVLNVDVEEDEGKAVLEDRKGTAKLNVLDDGTVGFFDIDERVEAAAGCAGGGGGKEGGGGGSLFWIRCALDAKL